MTSDIVNEIRSLARDYRDCIANKRDIDRLIELALALTDDHESREVADAATLADIAKLNDRDKQLAEERRRIVAEQERNEKLLEDNRREHFSLCLLRSGMIQVLLQRRATAPLSIRDEPVIVDSLRAEAHSIDGEEGEDEEAGETAQPGGGAHESAIPAEAGAESERV